MDSTKRDDKKKREKKEKKEKKQDESLEPSRKLAKIVEEAPLPRGGGRVASVADREPQSELFAASEKKKKSRSSEAIVADKGKKKAKTKKKGGGGEQGSEEEDVTAPVVKDGRAAKTISLRNCKPGTLLLALVTGSSAAEAIDVDLPHGLRATIELDLSEEVTAEQLYIPGDFLVVAVTSVKPFVVSLDPELVCQFQQQQQVQEGQMVVGRIASVEDHGWTVQVPLLVKKKKMVAFLPRAQVPASLAERLVVGRVVMAAVLSLSKSPPQLSMISEAAAPSEATLDSVLPGMLAKKLVLAEARQPEDGWRVQFGKSVVGDLHWTQLAARRLPPASLVVSSSARVLWVDMDRGCVGLSQLSWLLQNELAAAVVEVSKERVFKGTVVSVSGKGGVWLLTASGAPALAPVRLVSDDKEAVIEAVVAPGAQVACRLVRAPSLLDGTLHVGLAQSLLSAGWLLASELEAGQTCQVTVEKLVGKGNAVALIDKSAGQLRGFLPATHLRGVEVKKGARLECRVFSTNAETNKDLPVLTALKRFVRDADAPLTAATVKPGVWATGLVQFVKPTFAIISFYNSLTGLLPLAECSFAFLKSVQDAVKVGDAVRCRVVSANNGKLVVSLLPEHQQQEQQGNSNEPLPEVGSVVASVRVTRALGGGAGAEVLLPSGARGLVAEQHFSDWPRVASALARESKEGDELKELVVWGHDKKRHNVLLTMKQSYRELREKLPRTKEQLTEGTSIGACCVYRNKV
jgi:ribosomal protein S1